MLDRVAQRRLRGDGARLGVSQVGHRGAERGHHLAVALGAVAGAAEGAEEDLAVVSEVAACLESGHHRGPRQLLHGHLGRAQGEDVGDERVLVVRGQAVGRHLRARHHPPRVAQVLAVPIHHRVRTFHVREVVLRFRPRRGHREVDAEVAAQAADLVAAAASQLHRDGLAAHQLRRADQGVEVGEDGVDLAVGQVAERHHLRPLDQRRRILQVAHVPLAVEALQGDAGEIGPHVAALAVHLVAGLAAVELEEVAPALGLGQRWNGHGVAVAGAARGLQVVAGQHRVLPMPHVAVGRLLGGGAALAAVADRAAHARDLVVHRRVAREERTVAVDRRRRAHAHVTGGAAVGEV